MNVWCFVGEHIGRRDELGGKGDLSAVDGSVWFPDTHGPGGE